MRVINATESCFFSSVYTARKFFKDPELTSEITGFNKELIRKFSIIVQMASNKRINALKLERY